MDTLWALKKLLTLIAFSVLLLVPVGAQQVLADHPDILTCLPPGYLLEDSSIFDVNDLVSSPYCFHSLTPVTLPPPSCGFPYVPRTFIDLVSFQVVFHACHLTPQLAPDTTLAGQCQGAAVLVSNHCFAEALASMVGGILLSIDTTGVLVAAIGTDPVITGLVAITMAGIAGQAAWFIHRRKRKIKIE